MGYEPLFLARAMQWIPAEAASLLATGSAAESLAALRAGQVQAAALAFDEVLVARSAGLDLSVVLVMDVSMGADMLLVRQGVKTLQELKGLRVGLEESSIAEILLHEALRLGGLSTTDVQLVRLPNDQHIKAWQDQFVDALVTYEPQATPLLAQGARRLFDSRNLPNTFVDVLAVRNDLIQRDHRDSLRRVLAGHFRAIQHMAQNPQDAAYRMAPRLHLPAADVLSAFRGLLLPDAMANHRLLSGRAAQLQDTAQRLTSMLQSLGLIARTGGAANVLLRPEFLPEESL
ncbi:MAG: hypothetical protein Fur007_06630 [Rhodoferax sp.]